MPTVYTALLDVPVGDADIGSLRYGTCGAAPMPVEVFRAFEQRTGVKILEGYGLTEATVVSSANPLYGERRVGSIGLRLPYQPMKTVKLDGEADTSATASTSEIGTDRGQRPQRYPRLLSRTDERGAFLFLEDGWLNTGDLGRQDDEGYFWVLRSFVCTSQRRRSLFILCGGEHPVAQKVESGAAVHGRLMTFSRLICPSTGPVLQGSVKAACTASRS